MGAYRLGTFLSVIVVISLIGVVGSAGQAQAQPPIFSQPDPTPAPPPPDAFPPPRAADTAAPSAAQAANTAATVVISRVLDLGDNLIHGFIYDKGYLWASLRTSPARILRIDPNTLQYQRIELSAGLNATDDIVAAEGFIWTVTYTAPPRLIKINPTTLAWEVAATFGVSWSADSLAYAFGYLWVGGYDRTIARVRLSDLSYNEYTYPSLPERTLFHALTSGGGFLWANGIHYTPGGFFTPQLPYESNIVRIDPANPSTPTAVLLDQYMHDDIAYLKGHLYSGSEEPPSYMYKIANDLSLSKLPSTNAPSYGTFVNPNDLNHIWGAYLGDPGQVRVFNLDGSVVARYDLPQGYKDANELAFDPAGNIYVTAWESPAKIVKLAPIARGDPTEPPRADMPQATDRLFVGSTVSSINATTRNVVVPVGRNFGGRGGRPERLNVLVKARSKTGGLVNVTLNGRTVGPISLSATWRVLPAALCAIYSTQCDGRDDTLLKAPTTFGQNRTPPAAALNTIRITGPADLEVAWAAIAISRDTLPLVFVHGWTGDESTFGSKPGEADTNNFVGWAEQQGIPYLAPRNYYRGVEENEQMIAWIEAEILNAQIKYGVQKVNLVTHSRGGVVSRLGLDNPTFKNKVDGLVTLSSPHHGTGFMDTVSYAKCPFLPSADLKTRCWRIATSLMPDPMRHANYGDTCDPEYQYVPGPNGTVAQVLVGWGVCARTFDSQEAAGATINLRAVVGGLLDIGAPSATFPWLNSCNNNPQPDGVRLDELFLFHAHFNISTGEDVFNRTIDLLRAGRRTGEDAWSPYQCPPPLAHSAASANTSATAPSVVATSLDYRTVARFHGTLSSAAVATHTVTLAANEPARITLYTTPDITLTLRAPNGQIIGPAALPPSVTYQQTTDGQLKIGRYTMDAPQAGKWRLVVTQASVPPAPYLISVETRSAVALVITKDAPTHSLGQTVLLRAWLANNNVLLRSSVVISATLLNGGPSYAMHDDGTAGDRTARDGEFAVRLPAFTQAGHHTIQVDAQWPGGQRTETTVVTIYDHLASVSAIGLETATDLDDLGRWQALAFPVTIQSQRSGKLTLSGVLRAPGGTIVARTSQIIDVGFGTAIYNLRFDGTAIHDARRDGPYTLTDLILAGSFDGALTNHKSTLRQTTARAYRWTEFSGEPIQLAVTGSRFVPAVGNRPAQLIFTTNLLVDYAGTYAWTGLLYTATGQRVASSIQASRTIGNAGTIEIVFNLAAANSARPNTALELRDVTVWQVGGYVSRSFGLMEPLASWPASTLFLPLIRR